ncbi:glycosyl transferase family 2 [Paenibacillus mucilaginosus 3016]|uniref:Glycosyl transferase family 2 n=1 Tax=Paenibacillus mucilaginosus 3016 TaxID=1116391 RepID=H6NSY7_9BACL|nr:glycosyltransferase family 2 protein [Paenibacillus mucilaginosus]AFC27528.1 glycosyl transferase family 2 [Paenibacillus mucilaginosus 3016]
MIKNRTLVIIPAYNEEKSIAHVIGEIQHYVPTADVVVVNDGSKDRTAEVAKWAGAKVITMPFNVGIGGGMQTGYLYAQRNGYDYAVQIDADGQHNAADLPKLLKAAENNDLVIGSRYVTKTAYSSTLMRRIGMIFFSNVVTMLTHQKFTDTTSGYRVANKKVIDLYCNYYPMDYPEVEAIVYLKYKGCTLHEVSTEMRNRMEGESSINAFKSVYYMFKVTLSLFMNALRFSKARV